MKDYSSYSDDGLLRLLTGSDELAFTTIYDRHWKMLYLSACKVLQNTEAAQDAVHEVFLSLWHRRGDARIAGIGSLPAYLHGAIRRQVLKAIRAEKAGALFMDRLVHVSTALLTHEPLLFKELEKALAAAMASLPEDQRAIFRLHREQGMTYREIAAERRISVKTVEKKMSQSLRHIRSGLGDVLPVVMFYWIM